MFLIKLLALIGATAQADYDMIYTHTRTREHIPTIGLLGLMRMR